MSTSQKLLLTLSLALLLSACGSASAPGSAASDKATKGSQAWKPGSVGTVSADETEPATDGTSEVRFYNDYLRMLLRLDEAGGCTLTGGGVDACGSYAISGDTLLLDFGARRETAAVDKDGDVTLEGYSGYFLRDWNLWSITEEEVAGLDTPPRETLQLGDGKQRLRDYACQIAFTYSSGIEVLTGRLDGAVAATDGEGGHVTGRNVTSALAAFDGTPEAFLEDYIKTYTFADFAVFFGAPTGSDPLRSVSGKVKGRLAAASLRISGPEASADANVILYTSTYPDGTENYICKTYLVPAGDTARLKALEASVTDMAAVRMREERS